MGDVDTPDFVLFFENAYEGTYYMAIAPTFGPP